MAKHITISKQNYIEFSLLFILVVLLNPDFADISLLYWGSILCCLLSLIAMVFPRVSITRYVLWRAIFVVWAIFSYLFFASNHGSGYAFMMDLILQSLPLFTAAIYIKYYGFSYYKKLIRIFVIATCATCAYACFQSGFSNFMIKTLGYYTLGTQRWNSNYLGRMAAYGFIMLLISEKIDNIPLFSSIVLKAILILFFTITIMWCGSRTAIIIVSLGLIGYYVLSANNPIKTIRNIVLVIIGVIALYQAMIRIPALYSIIGIRMERLFQFMKTGTAGELSIGWRQQMIEYGLYLFKRNPIFGVGIDSFRIFYGLEGTSTFHATYAHNNYVELLADGGIVGFTVYYSAYIIGFVGCAKSYSNFKKYIYYMFFVLLFADMSTISYQSLCDQFLLCLLLISLDGSILENEHTPTHRLLNKKMDNPDKLA